MATTPLGRFVQAQLDARGELATDFAVRAGLGVSHVYQILRGERANIQKDTLDKIARGFGMTMAQMMTTIDPNATEGDPFVALARARTENQELKRVIREMKRVLSTLTAQRAPISSARIAAA